MNFHTKQKKFYNQYANSSRFEYKQTDNIAEKIELKTLLSYIENPSNKTVIDLGCGTGRTSIRIAPFVKNIIGVDISEKSLKIAEINANKSGINNFSTKMSDFKKVIFKNKIDYVFAVNMLHHTDEIHLILQNIKTSLKPNGKFIIFEFNPLNLLFIPFLLVTGNLKSHLNIEYIRSNQFTINKICKNSGFKVEKLDKYAFLPTALYNYSLKFKLLNDLLIKIPILNYFSAYNIWVCTK